MTVHLGMVTPPLCSNDLGSHGQGLPVGSRCSFTSCIAASAVAAVRHWKSGRPDRAPLGLVLRSPLPESNRYRCPLRTRYWPEGDRRRDRPHSEFLQYAIKGRVHDTADVAMFKSVESSSARGGRRSLPILLDLWAKLPRRDDAVVDATGDQVAATVKD